MKPPPFEYVAPKTLDAALEMLGEHGEDAKLLAGGQSLVPALNFRLLDPSLLVDINGLSELDFIEKTESGEIRIGAMVRQSRLEGESLIAQQIPLLHETIPHIAHPQIRSRGTLGGSLVHADPAAELPVVALALDARFRVQDSKDFRWIDAEDFFLGMFTTALGPHEILTEIEITPLPENTGCSFVEFARRSGDYAITGVGSIVTFDENETCTYARLVYLNVGDGPVDAKNGAELLIGEKFSSETIEAAANFIAENEIDPWGNVHASPAYQKHLVQVLTVQSLNRAKERAISTNSKNGREQETA